MTRFRFVTRFEIVPSRIVGWFYVLCNGQAVAEVDSLEQAHKVIQWWRDGWPS